MWKISICCSLWLPADTVATVVWRHLEVDESCSIACDRVALDCDDAELRRLAANDELRAMPAHADDVARSCDQRQLARSFRAAVAATRIRSCPCRRPEQRRLDDASDRNLSEAPGGGGVDGGSIVGGIFFVSIPCAFFIWLYRQMRKRPPPAPAIPQIIADGFPTVQTGAIAGPQGPGGPMVAIGRPVNTNSGPPPQAAPAGTVVPPHVPNSGLQANAAQATVVAAQPRPDVVAPQENSEDNQNLEWTGDEAPAAWTCTSCGSRQLTSSQFCGECGAARPITSSR